VLKLRYNNAYNVLRREMPSECGEVRYATIAATGTDGSALKAATECTIWGVASKIAVVTLASAVDAGDYECTLSLGTETTSLYPGDVLRIGGGTGEVDTLRARSYDATTYTVTFDDYFKADHAAGAYVVGRWVSHTYDTTTVATYTNLRTMTIEWAFSLVAGSPLAATRTWSYTDEAEIEKRTSASGDMEGRFRARYRRYYDTIGPDDWARYEADALQEVRDLFEARGKGVDKLIDSDRLDELHMAQIALAVAYAGGEAWEADRIAITTRRNEVFERLASLPLWTDDDQDLIKEDSETQAVDRPYPRRRI
jgi:hypothetical protein